MGSLSNYFSRAQARVLRVVTVCLACLTVPAAGAADGPRPHWDALPTFKMEGGLKVFWDVSDWSNGENPRAAVAHGFTPLTLLNTFSDYPGGQKENINNAIGADNRNPWRKPAFFERVVRRNITERGTTGVFVNDIEFPFEQNAMKAWDDDAVRQASGAGSYEAFEEAYFREWATWYSQPLKWTKEAFPETQVGIYGVQPFRRDFWGLSGKTALQIDGSHESDQRLWRRLDPLVDFYVASIYVFYNDPSSVFYMAANVEENHQRTRQYGDRPVYAYTWMRFHDSNAAERGRELEPYLLEAMAIVPYFSGARGAVLWGHEPQIKPGDGQPYERMNVYMNALSRVASLSQLIGAGRLVIDEPAHASWNGRRPLVRRVIVSQDECVLMATNPWQSDAAVTQVDAQCGAAREKLEVRGKSVALFHIKKGLVALQ